MARTSIADQLQVFPFWLLDVGPISGISLPLFTPIAGFSTITAPEYTAETEEIREGNWPFTRKVLKTGSVSAMTLTRGVTFYDSDFYRWMFTAIQGSPKALQVPVLPVIQVGGPTYRRTMLLIHYFARTPFSGLAGRIAGGALDVGLAMAAGAVAGGNSVAGLLQVGMQQALFEVAIGPFDFAARVPARAWILKGCIPKRYKAGSDFDASSAEVSVAELDMDVETFEEISLSL